LTTAVREQSASNCFEHGNHLVLNSFLTLEFTTFSSIVAVPISFDHIKVLGVTLCTFDKKYLHNQIQDLRSAAENKHFIPRASSKNKTTLVGCAFQN